MSTKANRSIRGSKHAVDYSTAGAGFVSFELPLLGLEGRLVRALFRMVSGTGTTCAIRVFHGEYTTSTDPSTVPDEDIVYDLPAAALAASATAASIDENIKDAVGGAYYGRVDLRNSAMGYSDRTNEKLIVSLTFDNPVVGVLLLRADLVA